MSEHSHWEFYGQPTRFVGRRRELHVLRESMRNAIDEGCRSAVLMMGSAGIGKTRLIGEFTESLDEHVDAVTVLNVACRPGSAPYQELQALLRERFYVAADDSPEAARQKVQAGLAQVLGDPESGEAAAHFIGHLVGLRYPRSRHILSVDADPRRIREKALESFVNMICADAKRVPMVIALDNLHLASQESLQLLLEISIGVKDAPLLFLASARSPFQQGQSAFIQSMRKVGQVLELQDLSDRESRQIVESMLSRVRGLPESFVQLTVEKAFGNPLSLEQILELQIERGAIEVGATWKVHPELLDDTRIPRNLRDVVRSKLSRLAPLEKRILEKAAAIGDVFWSGCVDMLRRSDEGEHWEEADRLWNTSRRTDELLNIIEGLRRRHIVLRNPKSSFPASRELTFKHTLEREVLYEGIEGPRRARYHRLVAQWLEAQDTERRAQLVEHIAMHWERGYSARKASIYYVKAGDRAFERHVAGEAGELYERALQCLTDDDAVERLAIFHKLAEVAMVLADPAEALGHCQEMLRIAWLLDDTRQGGNAYNLMGRAYRDLGEYDLAVEHFKNGLALFRRVEDIHGIAASADDIGQVHRMRGDMDAAEARIQEGLRLRRYLHDERSVAVSLRQLGNVYIERGAFKEAVRTLREALDIAKAVEDKKTVADALTSIGVVCAQRGEYERALSLWDEGLEYARQMGEVRLQGILLNNMGEAHVLQSDHAGAQPRLEAAVDIFDRISDRRLHSEGLRNLAAVQLHLGDYAGARASGERALEEAEELGARGQQGLARRALGEIASQTLYDDTPDKEERISLAQGHFDAAITDLSEVGLEAELGKTLLARGTFYLELLRADDARADLERAKAMFERLSMRDSLERAERLLAVLD